MKKIILLLTVMSVMSCKTSCIYEDKETVIGIVKEAQFDRTKSPYMYEVYIVSCEGGKNFILKTNKRYEVGEYVNVPYIK